MIKKIVFLGTRKIGYFCLKHLNKRKNDLNYEIVGVFTNPEEKNIVEYCNSNGLELMTSLDEYLAINKIDIGISVQFDKILKKAHIDKAKDIVVNLHMGPLPEYRGCNQFAFAIIDKAKEFGTTIHQLVEGIDSGDIMFEERFLIPENCWIEELYEITCRRSMELFERSLPELIEGNYVLVPQENYMKKRTESVHSRDEIEHVKKIELSWTREKIERYIRATSMPGYEPPYVVIEGKKVYFRVLKDNNL